jgi:hypothetical protein
MRHKRTKERRGESTPDQTEAGFNTLFLARAEREKLEKSQRSILSGTEVLTQTIVSQFKSEPSVKIRTTTCAPAGPPPHLMRFDLRTIFQIRQEVGSSFPDHTSKFTFTCRSAYHPGLRLFS